MKLVIVFLILLFQTQLINSQSKTANLESTFWINDDGDFISFGEPENNNTTIKLSDVIEGMFVSYYMFNDTIGFKGIDEVFESTSDHKSYTAKFKILAKTDSILTLNHVSENSKMDDNQFKLYQSISNTDLSDFKLKEIKILKSGYELVIDSLGQINLKVDWPNDIPLKEIDQSKFGSYTGQLTKEQISNLKYNLLRVGYLKGIDFNFDMYVSHIQKTEITIRYNEEITTHIYYWPNPTLGPFLSSIRNISDLETLDKIED